MVRLKKVLGICCYLAAMFVAGYLCTANFSTSAQSHMEPESERKKRGKSQSHNDKLPKLNKWEGGALSTRLLCKVNIGNENHCIS